MLNKEIRLVISGTYSTGKTTTATALSIATGIPLINALSAREILTDLYPGRRFQDMNATELMALGLKDLRSGCARKPFYTSSIPTLSQMAPC